MPTEINGYSPSEETVLSSLIINEVDSNETFEKMKEKGILQNNQLYLVTDELGGGNPSPYEIAKQNGYIGTEEEFNQLLAALDQNVTEDDLNNKADKSVAFTVSLTAAGWDSTAKTQTVTVTGISATETDQMITPTPALASQTAYYDAGILCTAQSADSLTFTCTTVPTEALTVYVVIQEVTHG